MISTSNALSSGDSAGAGETLDADATTRENRGTSTRYVIQRRSDGYYVDKYGFTKWQHNATRYDSMTEAEIAILSEGLSECDVIPVESK